MSWSYKFKRPLPRLFQFEALKKALKRKRFGLLFEQRVGKTRVAIDLCGSLHARESLTRYLVICPKSVLTVWPEAIEQYWNGPPCRVQVLGEEAPPDDGVPTFWIVNYDQIRLSDRYRKWFPSVLLADEIQFCKHHTSQRSRAVHKIADLAPYVLGMTGTPGKPENGWFGIMRVIDKSIYGRTMAGFEQEHLKVNYNRGYREVLGYKDEARMISLFESATMRVTREAAGIINSTEDVIVPVVMEPKAKAIYDKLDKDSYVKLDDGETTASIVLVKNLRLHQLAGGFLVHDSGQIDRVSKAKARKCLELVEDLRAEGKQVIIVCRFIPEIQALSNYLCESAVIDGRTTTAERKRILASFQAGDTGILTAQIQTIATGIDLTAAHHMIFYSVDFNLDTYKQVKDRVLGRAQKEHVTYWHLQVKGTVDKDVFRTLIRGENLVKALVDRRKWTGEAGGSGEDRLV